MEIKKGMIPEEYELKDGTKKTKWNFVGMKKVLDNGKEVFSPLKGIAVNEPVWFFKDDRDNQNQNGQSYQGGTSKPAGNQSTPVPEDDLPF